ncbi:MAG: GNAT family N-acetyltransferase [Desulfobacterales bacterium]|nr:GNAT family N-acetyltransferase [Desulfobacterales bacterium]
MQIVEVREVTAELLAAVNGLLPQLSATARSMSVADLAAVVKADASRLFMAVEEEKYYGMLTLICFATPTGRRARIEDLVVDGLARGKGAGRQLLAHAIQAADAWGARAVDLTSNPARLAANRLYQQMGFVTQSTHVYRLTLPR